MTERLKRCLRVRLCEAVTQGSIRSLGSTDNWSCRQNLDVERIEHNPLAINVQCNQQGCQRERTRRCRDSENQQGSDNLNESNVVSCMNFTVLAVAENRQDYNLKINICPESYKCVNYQVMALTVVSRQPPGWFHDLQKKGMEQLTPEGRWNTSRQHPANVEENSRLRPRAHRGSIAHAPQTLRDNRRMPSQRCRFCAEIPCVTAPPNSHDKI